MREEAGFEPFHYVSRETIDRFRLLESMVRKWNPAINLVSKDSVDQLRERHIRDSVQLFGIVDFAQGAWCDLGSGGGFPGLVIAILMQGTSRERHVKLVESDGRKAAFLREAVRQLELEAVVINARVEAIPALGASVLSARALAGLPKLCEFALRHLLPSGVALFPKGVSYKSEVLEARKNWEFDLSLHMSKTDPTAAILELRNIRHV
ncbi:MAG: 16S rRNA (guanine(527)-N(7))-methyltransferase RsmG [Paracoccaceae bacterium]